MENLIKEKVNVSILGKDYEVKELTFAQKNKLLKNLEGFISSLASHAFFRKNNNGNLAFSFIDEVSLAELNIDKIFLSSIDAMSELLKLSIPDFSDWDNLPESASRAALIKAVEVQDFKGYIANFFSLGAAVIH